MKAILISIKPKSVAKILNREKTIEIRKTCPEIFKHLKPYEGCSIDVYIYCTKDKQGLWLSNGKYDLLNENKYVKSLINGKVVAKFTLNKVGEIRFNDKEVQMKSCLTEDELFDYLFVKEPYHEDMKTGYAWHISNLEIFDKPKELWQFKTPKNHERYQKELEQAYEDDAEINTRLYEGYANDNECANNVELTELIEYTYGLQKAPQSWCYVEVEE